MINWDLLKKKVVEVKPMFGVLFGCSGSGKSSALGTTGLTTLVVHGPTENHAATNAKTRAEDPSLITGLDYTVYAEDGKVNFNASYKNLLTILRDPGVAEAFEVVALDSLTELQSIVAGTTQFTDLITNDKGKINKFHEGDAYLKLMGEVINALLNLQQKGVHVFATCAAVIKSQDETGEAVEAKPMLQGFSVGDGIARSFSDVLFVNLLRTEEGPKHTFLFQPTLGMASKDLNGKVSKMSFANFTPRLSYYLRDQLPETADVDLGKIIKARKARA